jgi:hypothetical protein
MFFLRKFWFFLMLISCFGLFSPNSHAQILEEDHNSYLQQGFFFSVEYGPFFFIARPPSLDAGGLPGRPSSDIVGSFGGIQLGYDISERFALQFSFLTTQVRGDTQYGGGSGTYLFNLSAAFSFVRINRLFIYARAGAGLILALPEGVYQAPGLAVHVGLGLRLYTKMRHFSFGAEILSTIRIPTSSIKVGDLDKPELAVGIGLLPYVRYTF